MRSIILTVFVMFLSVSCATALPTVIDTGSSIVCDAPTTNNDGTPITDLVGYDFYYSDNDNSQVDAQKIQTLTCNAPYTDFPVVLNNKYISVTARDSSGNESQFSNEVQIGVAIVPANPTNNRKE